VSLTPEQSAREEIDGQLEACGWTVQDLASVDIHAGRILFLVDRNSLGRQTLNEFQQFRDPASPYTFTDEVPVQHLRGNTIEPATMARWSSRLLVLFPNLWDVDLERDFGA